MKNLITVLLCYLLLLPLYAIAQPNLVSNGSFEDTIGVCNNGSVVNKCRYWRAYTNATPDYFNACNSGLSVPVNFSGYQHAAQGQAYCGFLAHIAGQSHMEYIAGTLQPLMPGATYEVSISVNKSNLYSLGTDNIGIYFYDVGPNNMFISTLLNVTPQIYYDNYGVISDTVNWVRLTKTFVADSTYDNLVIGAYNNSSNTYNVDTFGSNTMYAYYYVDSVVVKLFDSLSFVFNDSTLCAGDVINVPYTVTKKKQPNNVFTLQMSNASGSFASPVNIGSRTSDTSGTITATIPANTTTGVGYRLRIITSNYLDTSYQSIALKIGSTIVKPDANNNGPVCANDTLKLTATTTTAGVTYKWAGPNGFNSTLQNPKINIPLPANSGDYIVTASLYGCEAKDTTTVVVNAGSGPTGTLATSNAPMCADDTLKLFGTANGSGNSYSWTGPNNYTSNAQNPVLPTATVAMSGDYVLYATNGNCTSRDTVTVLVKPRPAAFSATSNSPICTGETLNFTATSTSTGVTYAWAGPNGFNSTSATPFIGGATPIHNGDYYVTATLNGCTLKDTVTAVVKPLPVKPVAGSNTPICAGETLNLTATTPTVGVSYDWAGINSFTSTTQNPTISNTTTAMSGDYIVTATLNGCIQKDTTTVLVKPMPAVVTAGSNSPVCAGSTLQLTIGTSTTGATYAWVGPNSFTANTQNTSVSNSTTAATGWYVATVDLNGCKIKDSVNATVNPIPATPTASYSNPLCVGQTLNLAATTVAGATYSWTGIGGYTANIQNPTRSNMQFGDTGLYNVTASVNGCTSPIANVRVRINPLPFVVIFPTPGDTICVGDNATFTALPNNHGGVPQYQWYINNTPVSGSGVTFSSTQLAHGDVVRCNMTENTKCNSAYTDESNDVEMKVLPWLAPSVTFTANPNRPLEVDEFVTFTATPTNAGASPTYQWKRNGQNVQGATGSVWSANTLNDNDSISVEVISSYKCPQPLTGSANGVRVRILTGVGDVNNINGVRIYPNPNNGKFTVSGSVKTNDEVSIILYNTVGQNIYTKTFIPANKTLNHEVSIPEIAAGIYMVKITQSGQTAVTRFRVN